jgi:hypothetical protein
VNDFYKIYNDNDFEDRKEKRKLLRESTRALRRNVRLRLKQGFYENLPEVPKITKENFESES